MRFASLGSGSSGNALLIEHGHTRLMLDCGFGLKETVSRLARRGLQPQDLTGIIVTHAHADHISGVDKLCRKFGVPVWLTYGTWKAVADKFRNLQPITCIDSNVGFRIGEIELFPFTVPHDCREPVQYVVSGGGVKLGVLTDTGRSTPFIEETLSGCDALILECNHDRDMLEHGPYHPRLKRRVAGPFGHLDNETAAGILARIDCSRLQYLVAAHLSEQNNSREKVLDALCSVLSCARDWIIVADQTDGYDWLEIQPPMAG